MKPIDYKRFLKPRMLAVAAASLLFAGIASAQNPFPEVPTLIEPMDQAKLQFVDIDNDGDMDLFTMGREDLSQNPAIKLYENNAGVFSQVRRLPGVVAGGFSWFDYDQDQDLDLAAFGTDSLNIGRSFLYTNDGNFTFSQRVNPFLDISWGDIATADFNNDGLVDVFVCGSDLNGVTYAFLYWNTGGNFSPPVVLPGGLSYGFVESADIDLDHDVDLLMFGYDEPGNYGSVTYRNDNGAFTATAGIHDLGDASGEMADFDEDGDADLVVIGYDSITAGVYVYANDGAGNFSLYASNFDTLEYASVHWGDIDNDGDLDLLMTGYYWNSSHTYRTSLLLNNSGVFENANAPFAPLEYGDGVMGDYDGDGKLDVFLMGSDSILNARLYHNLVTTVQPNANPQVPSNLSISSPSDSILEITWTAPTDDFTPSAGLCYELVIGTSSGDHDVATPPSALATGYHRISNLGSIQGTTWRLHTPTCGVTYYAKVQAIDGMYTGSAFSAEASHRYPFSTAITFADDAATVVDGAICDSIKWLDISTNTVVPGATGATFVTGTSGSFAAILYRFGCVDTTDAALLISATEGKNILNAVTFPNPAQSQVTMRLPQGNNIADVSVHDMQGRITGAAVRVSANEATCSLEGLAPGIYLLKATTRQGAKVATATFVKQ